MRTRSVAGLEQGSRSLLVGGLVGLILVFGGAQPRRALALDEPCGCTCAPIGKDPGVIRFSSSGESGHDYLRVHGTINPVYPKDDPYFDPTSEDISFVLSNADGVIASGVVPPLTQTGGMRWVYQNSEARRAKSGVDSLTIQYRVNDARDADALPGRYTFDLIVYTDLSAATVADMAFKLSIGDDCFVHTDTWKRTGNGWTVRLLDE